jgi:hypothetical protein
MADGLSEIAIVTRFRSRARIQCPAVRIVGIPNASKRGQWAVNQAKREGMSSGFPDMMCIWMPGPGDRGIAFIEWKREHGGRLSLNQIEWLARLKDMGFPAVVSSDPDHALDFLREAGAPFLVGRRAA